MNAPSPANRSLPSTWATAAALALVLLATLRAAWSTLDRGFLGDDFVYVARFHALPFSAWPALFLNDWSGGVWELALPELRPFAALSFWLDAHLWGVNPLGFHLTNLALDTACAWLVLLIVCRLHAAPLWAGVVAGVLFAWHPAHAEPVAWITGRVDLLATAAYLAAFFASVRYLQAGGARWLAAATAAAFVGCFSKEFCLTLPIVVLLWAWFFRPTTDRSRLWHVAIVLVAVGAAFLLCRRLAFGPGAGTVTPLGLLSTDYAERQFDYLRWYWPPLYHPGSAYRPQVIHLAPPVLFGGAAVALAALLLWRWRNPAPAAWRLVTFYLAAWYAIATLPLAAASYFSPRHLYFATAGLTVGLGLLLAHLARKRAWLAAALALLFAWICLPRFDHAVGAWRRAAKVSERLVADITARAPALARDEVLVLDVPPVHEGVWLWAYAAPHAWLPPFGRAAPVAPVLTAPSVYYAPHVWAKQPAWAALTPAARIQVLSLDAKSQIQVRSIPPGVAQAALATLLASRDGDAEAAWRRFLSDLSRP